MLTASVENMLVTSIDTTLETGVVPTQYIVIISTARQQSDSDNRKLLSNVGSTFVRLLISFWVYIPKDSFKIVNTLPSDIFKVAAISHNFNLRSLKTFSCIYIFRNNC